MHEMICQLKLKLLDLFAYRGRVRIGLPIYDEFHRLAVEFCVRFGLHDDQDWKVINSLLLCRETEYLTNDEASEISFALDRLDSHLGGNVSAFTNEDGILYGLFHPRVVELSRPRIESRCYADAVECVLKEINSRVKRIVRQETNIEMDGTALMQKAFSLSHPIIKLVPTLESQSDKDIQQGYQFLFAGAMCAIRNPKAHANVSITKEEALRFLMFASILMGKLDN